MFEKPQAGQVSVEQFTPRLPTELLRYVSLDRLEKNALAYPEMNLELTEIQKERIKKIKEVLKQIPLIHISSHEQITKGEHDLLPASQLPEDHRGHSLESDKSLGLTQCVFFNWGLAQKGFGRFVIQASADLLDDPGVFVTPTDFGHIEFADERPYDDFEAERKERIEQHYFSKMVTGQVWKEIIARRILKAFESGQNFMPLHTSFSLGEIKYFGSVPAKYILGSFKVSDLRAHYKFLYEHGFAFANMEQNRMLLMRTGKKTGVDPSHEECGIDYESARQFWNTKLGIE